MTSLHVIYSLALPPIQNHGYDYALNHVQYAYQLLHLRIVDAPSRAVAYNIAKMQSIRCIAASLKFLWYGNDWYSSRAKLTQGAALKRNGTSLS